MKVYSAVFVGNDGLHYPLNILHDLEQIAQLQKVGIIQGEVSELVGMQYIADCVTADLEKQMHTATGGVLQ